MRLEICVVAYEGEDHLERAIRSVAPLGPDVGVAVHDNSPSPLALTKVRQTSAAMSLPLRVEACGGNCGFAGGCNSLARGSSAEWLLFLNPDVEIIQWPTGLPPPGEEVIGARVEDELGRLRSSSGSRRTILEEFAQRWIRTRPSARGGRGYVSGAALLVPRQAFLRLNGFDPRFFMYYEDIDFCDRAVKADLKVGVDERWRVRHAGGHAANRDRGTALVRSYESARLYYGKSGQSVFLYRVLLMIDTQLRLALFRFVPSKREWIPGLRQLRRHITHAAAPPQVEPATET